MPAWHVATPCVNRQVYINNRPEYAYGLRRTPHNLNKRHDFPLKKQQKHEATPKQNHPFIIL